MRTGPLWVPLVAMVGLVGCDKRESAQMIPPPASQSDSLMRAIAPELGEWVEMWSAAIPGFQPDSLIGSPPVKMRPAMVVGADQSFILDRERRPDDSSDLTSNILGLPSPDGRRYLDIDSYQLLQLGNGTIEAGGEPDSRSALLDRSTKSEAVLFVTGTMAGAHWGRWLSADRFVLAGWQEVGEQSEGRQGWLSHYDLRDSMVTEYVTRVVSPADYDHYYSAWKQWLFKRYREIQVRPRS